jgi:hypothetical protein
MKLDFVTVISTEDGDIDWGNECFIKVVPYTPPLRPGFESGHVGFVVDISGTGAGFLRVLRFLLPFRIQPIVPLLSGAGTIGRTVVAVPSGLSLTP